MSLDTAVINIVFTKCKSYLAFVIDKDGQRVEISYQHPLSHVKFTFIDDQRFLNLLLSNINIFLFVDQIKYFIDV